MHFALLIRGEQGSGKSAIGELMRRIIGDRNVVKPSNDEVTGRFTAWLEGAQLAEFQAQVRKMKVLLAEVPK